MKLQLSEIELTNGLKFWIKSNLEDEGLDLNDALDSWVLRTEKYSALDFINYLNSKPNIKAVLVDAQVSQPSEPLAERYYMNLPKDRKKILDAHHYELFTNEKSAQENLSRDNYLEPDNFETVVIVIDNRERRSG